MSVLIDENQTQNFLNVNYTTDKKGSKTENNFDKTLEEVGKENIIVVKEDAETRKKLIEELLNKIREIVNSGINPAIKEKIDKLLKKVEITLNDSSKNGDSIKTIENLLAQIQSLMKEQSKNFSGNILDNIDIKNNLKDIFSQTEEEKKSNNQHTPINNYKRVDIDEELKKFQNIKLDI